MHPNVLVIGEPGSGKTVGTAVHALRFPGAVVALDPHNDSLSSMLLEHRDGDVLFHRLSDLDHALGYDLLRPSAHPDPATRLRENRRRARQLARSLMRRRGGEIAAAPLTEEYVIGLFLMALFQGGARTDPAVVPFGLRPGTGEFDALVRGCELDDLRHKFRQLEKLGPRALRAEVGPAARLVEPVFGEPEFLAACRPGVAVGAHVQRGGWLLLERGTADHDVARTVYGGLTLEVTEHCEARPVPDPPVLVLLDECTNARTAGDYEETKAGETRKLNQPWGFVCQHPNFPNGPEGFFQNCQEKHFYRTGDYGLARKLAAIVVGASARGGESHAAAVERVAGELMTFRPGERYAVGPGGVRRERVRMPASGWDIWPGLRQSMLEEKLCRIYERPEYRTSARPGSGGPATPPSSTSSGGTPPPPPSSPPSSPAERWEQERRRRAGGSPGSGGGGG